MRKFVSNLCKKNKIIRKIVKCILGFLTNVRYIFYKVTTKVDNKMIIFEAYQGRNYACSPKEIYLKMIDDPRFKDFKFIWCFKDTCRNLNNKNTIIIKSKSNKYYKYFSKSKYWIVNSLLEEAIKPKKNQVFLQCWHGTPLKKLRYDIEHDGVLNDTKEIKKRNDIDTRRFTYFISPSKFATKCFTSAFNLKKLNKENIIIEKGYPRNDYLYNYKSDDVEILKKKLNIPKNKKVILYAPTFRDNQHESGLGYTYSLGLDIKNLYENLKDEYVILFRTHYFVSNTINFEEYKGFIYDVSKYDDVSRLYIISDLLITDYSSVFFDYANLKRPIIFYMYDLDEYKNKLRDFYINLDELPGPILENEKDLLKEIKNYSFDKYKSKYEKFNKKFNYLDDGNASDRVIDVVFNDLQK